MPLVLGGSSAVTAAFSVDNSCRFDGSTSYMHKTPSTGDRRKWTLSLWVKDMVLASGRTLFASPSDGSNYDQIWFSGNYFRFDHWTSGSTAGTLITERVFRDPAAWYHLVVVWDSDNADAGERMKLYFNGTESTAFSQDTNPSLNADSYVNSSSYPFEIGSMNTGEYLSAYLAEVVFCDGQAYAASDFGEFDEDSTAIWKPKDVSGLTFGTNGFYLDFKDSANLGNDANGGTDFTEVNLAAADQSQDSPTNNFCTMNSLDNFYAPATFSQGNTAIVDSTTTYTWKTSTFALAKGKWYCEWLCVAEAGDYMIGISASVTDSATNQLGDGTYAAESWGYRSYDGKIRHNSALTSYGDTWDDADIIGIYLDLDNNKMYFSKNGAIQNSGTGVTITDPSTLTLGVGAYMISSGDISSAAGAGTYNFGNGCFGDTVVTSSNADANGYGLFEYSPNDGGSASFDGSAKDFLAICSKNLGSDGG